MLNHDLNHFLVCLLRQSLDACVASCEGGCELVVGGYSQGAAAATVASIDLLHYKPDVIMFAAPPAIIASSACTASDQLNYYGFVNSDFNGYDIVANQQIRLFGEKFLGPAFLMDDFNFPLSMPSERQIRRGPGRNDLHMVNVYKERIYALANGGCFPLPVARWPMGHYCHYDDECASSSCMKRNCMEGL